MKILVVEDELKLAKAIQKALQLQKYVVDLALDGEEGYDLATDAKYDAIILDLMLPKLSGIEVCQKLRAAQNFTPILMLTARTQVSDKVSGLDAGADDYLIKPFSFTELFARLRALTRRSAKITQPTLVVGELSLNPITFEVKRNQKNIQLSAREFAILEYLMRHKNTIITREQIVQQVWNYDADVLPTTVEVHIKHLRDKIDLPPAKPLIATVRGFGYKITDS